MNSTRALCASDPSPDDWFADPIEDAETAARAVKICGTCPELLECRDQLSENEHGVWGGYALIPLARHEPELEVNAPRKPGRPKGHLWVTNEAELHELVANGWTTEDLGKKYGVTDRAVQRYIREHDLRPARKDLPSAGHKVRVVEMWNAGVAQDTIAAQLEITRRRVSNIIWQARKAGRQVRPTNYTPADWDRTLPGVRNPPTPAVSV